MGDDDQFSKGLINVNSVHGMHNEAPPPFFSTQGIYTRLD